MNQYERQTETSALTHSSPDVRLAQSPPILNTGALSRFAADARRREETLEDIATQILFLTNNAMPGERELLAFTAIVSGQVGSIPTDRLQEMLTKATTDAAPFAPKVGNLLQAWKQEMGEAPRATFQDIERRQIESGKIPSLDTLADTAPLQFKIHQRIGFIVVCNCPPWIENKKTVPRPAQLDENGAFWRCGQKQSPCDFLVDARKESAVRKASVESSYSRPASTEATPPTSSSFKTKGGGRLQLFVEECGLTLAAQNEDQLDGLRRFCKWCDSQVPPVRPTAATWEEAWNDWQFDLAAEVAA